MDSSSPSVSFIGIVDFTEDARWVYCSESVHDLLGFEPYELTGTPSLDLVHPDEFPQVRAIHYSTITQDQAAVLVYLRLRHKDPCKGYVLCAISRTVCQGVLVGSVSFASPGPKAMHNASTAQEVTIITPTAKDFEFRRWGDPNPMPPCPVPANLIPPDAPPSVTPMRFAPLPEQSVRTALILDRFSLGCSVLYCSNDSLLRTTAVLGRSFFDFVIKRDEELVRSWIDVIKSWGVNERGQPSDGGFGFGKFTLLIDGRDSSEQPQRAPPPSRRAPAAHRNRAHSASSPLVVAPFARPADAHAHAPRDRRAQTHPQPAPPRGGSDAQLVVDAIFSAHSDGLMVILRPSNAAARASTSPTAGYSALAPPQPHAQSQGQGQSQPPTPPTPVRSPGYGALGLGLATGGLRDRDVLGLTRDSLTLPPILTREERDGRPGSSASSGSGYSR